MYPADGADCPRIRCDVTETRTWAAPSSRATRPERCNTGEGPTSTAGPSPAMRPYRPVPNRAIGSMSSCSSSAGCGTSASVSRSTAERSTVVAVLADDPGPQRLVDPLDDAVDGVMLLQPVEHRAQLRFGAPQTGDGVQVLPFVVRGRRASSTRRSRRPGPKRCRRAPKFGGRGRHAEDGLRSAPWGADALLDDVLSDAAPSQVGAEGHRAGGSAGVSRSTPDRG